MGYCPLTLADIEPPSDVIRQCSLPECVPPLVFVCMRLAPREGGLQTRSRELAKEGVIMSRTLTDFARFIGNVRYYCRNGCNLRRAWQLARLTLP